MVFKFMYQLKLCTDCVMCLERPYETELIYLFLCSEFVVIFSKVVLWVQVRDKVDMYKGVGINLNDPYENFRKSKGQAFINRMKARAEERL